MGSTEVSCIACGLVRAMCPEAPVCQECCKVAKCWEFIAEVATCDCGE